MEASALFTLGSFRNVEVAVVLVTGDLVLPEGWIPGFMNENVVKIVEKVTSAMVESLVEIR
ncbi:MAG: hypothetical protein M9901_13375 [Lentimicrobium sp.]|nr:hypothetical protein [Lentimicrobium sp.]